MSTASRSSTFRRDSRRGLLGGVLAGLSARTGIDVVAHRVAFVVIAVATGGLALRGYLVAWAGRPGKPGVARALARRLPRARRNWRLVAGAGLLTLSALLAFRELGIWWSDALAWPLVLAAFGSAVLWERSRVGGRDAAADDSLAPPPPSPTRFTDSYRGIFGV